MNLKITSLLKSGSTRLKVQANFMICRTFSEIKTGSKTLKEQRKTYYDNIWWCGKMKMKTTAIQKAFDLFYGKDRDMLNYPPVKVYSDIGALSTQSKFDHPDVKYHFLPKRIFKFIEKKTGTSGFFVIFLGFWNLLLSKEIIIYNFTYIGSLHLFFGIYTLSYFFGHWFIDRIAYPVMKGDQGLFSDLRMNYHQAYKMIREQINSEYESIINQGDIFLARKINAELLLENEYRSRIDSTHKNLMNSLRYLSSIKSSEDKIHAHFTKKWIKDRFRQSLDSDFQQKIIDQCINNLDKISII